MCGTNDECYYCKISYTEKQKVWSYAGTGASINHCCEACGHIEGYKEGKRYSEYDYKYEDGRTEHVKQLCGEWSIHKYIKNEHDHILNPWRDEK